jgi:GntR family transcriptional regulator, transcriptional repressor for pyruvate dehydrogenase complex
VTGDEGPVRVPAKTSRTATRERERDTFAVTKIKPAYQQVSDQLRALILSGELGPGDRLPVESELSTTFGVSRSTVREALRSLSAQNLVYTSRGVAGGTFIADASPPVLSAYLETGLSLLNGAEAITTAELLEARELFEVPATRLAARRRTEEHLEEMREAARTESAATDRGATFEHNSRFHAVVLEAAGNRLAEVMITPIFGVIRSRFLASAASDSFWHQVDTDHLVILEHIETGDADAAAAAMHEHLGRLSEAYQQHDGTR